MTKSQLMGLFSILKVIQMIGGIFGYMQFVSFSYRDSL